MSELKLGLTIPFPYTRVLRAKLDPKIVTKISYSVDYDRQEAMRDQLIDSVYKSREDLEKQIKAFAKRFAPQGRFKNQIQLNKVD